MIYLTTLLRRFFNITKVEKRCLQPQRTASSSPTESSFYIIDGYNRTIVSSPQETENKDKLKTYEDFMSLSMPLDDEELNKTVKELHRMSIIPNADTNVSKFYAKKLQKNCKRKY